MGADALFEGAKAAADGDSPDSPSKSFKKKGTVVGGGLGGAGGGVSKKVIDELKATIEEQEKKMTEKIIELTTKLTEDFATLSKRDDDHYVHLKKIEHELTDTKKKLDGTNLKLATLGEGGGGGGGGKVSGA
jgi:hypothetical protein